MAKIAQTSNPNNSISTPGLTIKDEFLPYVKFSLEDFHNRHKKFKEAEYDKHLEMDAYSDEEIKIPEIYKQDFKKPVIQCLKTDQKRIKLFFVIEDGTEETWDDDGLLAIKISTGDKAIKITSPSALPVKKKYGDALEVALEITSEESKEFFVDFFANDNSDDTFIGEMKDVPCGRVKIVYQKKTVCSDWPKVAPVIAVSKFIGWGHPNIKQNCYHYVVEQLRVSGNEVESGSWKDWSKKELTKNKGIYQLFLEADVAGMKKGVQKGQFEKGIEYLKGALQNGIPVMAGVDDGYKKINDDDTTEHFVTIVGMGEDTTGKYFLFYDNAVGDAKIGASNNNKLYCDCKNYKISGTGDLRNTYIQSGTKKQKYILTQIRETK